MARGQGPPEKKNLRVLVVVAHADDMEFFAGGTIAKLIAQGAHVVQVIATNNEKGSFFRSKEEMIQKSREEEALRASKLLQIQETLFLEYPDGELNRFDRWELKERCVRVIRQKKPHLLFTWDPFAPYEFHPDHRAIAEVASEAAFFAHLPSYFPEHFTEGLTPHVVAESYFFAKHPVAANRVVDIAETMQKKIESLLCHRSQMELTLQDVACSLRAAGVDPSTLGVPEEISEEVLAQLVEQGVRQMAEEAAQGTGYRYAEKFHYEGYGLARKLFPDLEALRGVL